MPRPAITLVYVSRQSVVRADFRNGTGLTPCGQWEQLRPDLPDLASAVEYALSLGPIPARSVWVLATDVWAQVINLPLSKAAGLASADLAQVLNFEAESLSNIPAMEATVGVEPLAPSRGERPCWIAQVRIADRDAVADAVRRSGSQLAGICHPGGLPRPLGGNPDAPFGRVELWPDAVIGTRRHPDRRLDIQVWNTDPPMGRWQADAVGWLGPATADEAPVALVADGFASPKDWAGPVVRLDAPDRLAEWLQAWAALLAGRAPGVPVVTAAARPMSFTSRVAVAVGLALIAAALCFAQYTVLDRKEQDLAAALAIEQKKLKDVDRLKRLADTRKAERDRLRADRKKTAQDAERLRGDHAKVIAIRQTWNDLEAEQRRLRAEDDRERRELEERYAAAAKEAARELGRQRERYERLLQELGRGVKPDGLVIRTIDRKGGVITLTGVALEPRHADQLASILAEIMKRSGWEPQAAAKKHQPRGRTDLWEFTIELSDTGAPPPPEWLPRWAADGIPAVSSRPANESGGTGP